MTIKVTTRKHSIQVNSWLCSYWPRSTKEARWYIKRLVKDEARRGNDVIVRWVKA